MHLAKSSLVTLRCIIGLSAFLCVGCQPSYYRLTMAYIPQKTIPGADANLQRFVIAVATFNDQRSTTDRSMIGKRIKSDGSEIKACSQLMLPGQAVAAVMRDFFYRHGYTVYGGMPDWDLDVRSIDSRWGTLVVGGDIEELSVTCTHDLLTVQYDTTVRLRVVFADAQRKSILYSRTLESSASYKHVRFQQERMEQELNAALSTAIEKLFEDDKVSRLIDELTAVRSESIRR
ncbi:MAG: YajG family lipoprotein [Desulfobacterota bacterium]|nr:YajG family lipoprotein [Thermodesulfobacteriota bacterium]